MTFVLPTVQKPKVAGIKNDPMKQFLIIAVYILLAAPPGIAQPTVGYEPNTKSWYSVEKRTEFVRHDEWPMAVTLIGSSRQQYTVGIGTLVYFNATHAFLDTSGAVIYYGNGPFIEYEKPTYYLKLDSIPAGGDILALHQYNPSSGWAILHNSGENYLFHKQDGKWSLNPVLVKDNGGTGLRTIIWVLSLFLLAALLTAIIVCLNMRRSIADSIRHMTEENALLTKSEKPLGIGEEDLLGFASMEAAITRIIRNPQLELPLTIVVSGTWGSGKSSMMNRIRESLQQPPLDRRFMTTWFNAWHLQGEASLLNTFLLNIIDTYEDHYKFYSPFRLRLAYKRYSKLPFWKKFGFGFAAALLLPFFMLVMLQVLPIGHPRSWDWVNSYCVMLSSIFFSAGGLTAGLVTPVGAGLLILCSVLFVNRQFIPSGLSAFFELLPKNNFRLEVEGAEIGSREKFRRQYWQIMAAAKKDTRLVIFIDDLDRIEGDKVLALLEGINFISDIASRPPGVSKMPPNTIFVLGMYTQEVARQVGAQLNKINQSEVPDQALGTLYIEKMVQLIVPVPFDTDNQEKLKRLYEN
jgi:hypothetical protein